MTLFKDASGDDPQMSTHIQQYLAEAEEVPDDWNQGLALKIRSLISDCDANPQLGKYFHESLLEVLFAAVGEQQRQRLAPLKAGKKERKGRRSETEE
jgi:hypothetical protein